MLVTGELVKDEYFTLFEAVGALEVRDIPRRTLFTSCLVQCDRTNELLTKIAAV